MLKRKVLPPIQGIMHNTRYKMPGKWGNTVICMNCSNTGHTSKNCPHPITSYGVILVRYANNTMMDTLTFEAGKFPLEFLLIQRKNSIGFIEIVRGKYRTSDTEYIKKNISGMTVAEKAMLHSSSYDELWDAVWGPTTETSHTYRHEKEQGRMKFDLLRSATPSLTEILEGETSAWDTPEWGFPKGRKNMYESDYDCAMREMWEETNIHEKQIIHIKNLEPISEVFTGTNGVKYCHKYFVAFAPPNVQIQSVEISSATNEHIAREVGDIKWVSLADANTLIRDENQEKRELLLRVNRVFMSYCPIQLAPIPHE